VLLELLELQELQEHKSSKSLRAFESSQSIGERQELQEPRHRGDDALISPPKFEAEQLSETGYFVSRAIKPVNMRKH
jgi:hypothetical protein